jgi:hypothetical protein
MAKQFLHISFKFSDNDPKIEKLKPVFNKAIDWFRYTSNCWIVWTSSSSEKWYDRLRPLIKDEDSMFIVRLDMSERQGWMSKSAWEWMNTKRSED